MNLNLILFIMILILFYNLKIYLIYLRFKMMFLLFENFFYLFHFNYLTLFKNELKKLIFYIIIYQLRSVVKNDIKPNEINMVDDINIIITSNIFKILFF